MAKDFGTRSPLAAAHAENLFLSLSIATVGASRLIDMHLLSNG